MRIREAAEDAVRAMLWTVHMPRAEINGYAWATLAHIARAGRQSVPLAPWHEGPQRREHSRSPWGQS